jgi:hypothetical protein
MSSNIIHGVTPSRRRFSPANFGPDDERLLLNCFGPEYLKTTSRLLRLDWLRMDRVRSNLQTAYGSEFPDPQVAIPANDGKTWKRK